MVGYKYGLVIYYLTRCNHINIIVWKIYMIYNTTPIIRFVGILSPAQQSSVVTVASCCFLGIYQHINLYRLDA